ncbi:MAG: hypothetical protein QE272_11860 [Nevskia sp.]|nr:hypothetical protein [Nevskia sp.]
MPAEPVEGDAGEHQQQRVDQHRKQRETDIADAEQHHGQGHRAARWMQAAQAQHRCDRQAGGGGRNDEGRRIDPAQTGNSNQRRQRIAGDRRPGLSHRAGRCGKHQHGGGAKRGDHPGAVDPEASRQQMTQSGGKPDAERRTDHDPRALLCADVDRRRQ